MFLCFLYFLSEIGLTSQCFMQTTCGDQSILDIGLTVKANKEIIPSIPTAHAASSCDTGTPDHGAGKAIIVKILQWEKSSNYWEILRHA